MMNVGMRSFYPIGVFGGLMPMRRTSVGSSRMRPLVAALAATLALPAAAQAAAIQTDRACYLQTAQTTVTLSGTGFAPYTPYTAALDGAPLGSATTNDQGALQAAIKPPAMPISTQQKTYTVTVQADQPAATTFTVTRFLAGFAPTKGDPAALRVRFAAFGFGLGGGTPDIYLHYVGPRGHLAKTIRLGRAQGQCGSIERTAMRRLFPFAHPRHGRWRLQFDTSKTYRLGVKGSPFLFYTVGVNVHAAPGA
jgi:hypothetical protein